MKRILLSVVNGIFFVVYLIFLLLKIVSDLMVYKLEDIIDYFDQCNQDE